MAGGAFLILAALVGAAEPDMARGIAAVGTRPSAEPALRREENPSADFALGASLKAWANAAEEVRYAATHKTGDGGDAEALAEACADERIAFRALEKRRTGMLPAGLIARSGMSVSLGRAWQNRVEHKPESCP